ncbi:MAG: hypothetical protein H6594_11145 [Flavobacteriales bacterium]|nr:hypothetical protein [Flavobacteriales bacterium]
MTRSLLLLTAILLFRSTSQAVVPDGPNTGGSDPDPGFVEAIFDATSLSDLLHGTERAGVRFYNVMASASSEQGTVMAIAIDAEGNEVAGDLEKPYVIDMGMVKGRPTVAHLSANEAHDACARMEAMEHPSYSTSFSRAEIEALLAVNGCQALHITPDMCANGNTMRLTAATIEQDRVVDLGEGEGFIKLCGDPCPTVCGPTVRYVNSK